MAEGIDDAVREAVRDAANMNHPDVIKQFENERAPHVSTFYRTVEKELAEKFKDGSQKLSEKEHKTAIQEVLASAAKKYLQAIGDEDVVAEVEKIKDPAKKFKAYSKHIANEHVNEKGERFDLSDIVDNIIQNEETVASAQNYITKTEDVMRRGSAYHHLARQTEKKLIDVSNKDARRVAQEAIENSPVHNIGNPAIFEGHNKVIAAQIYHLAKTGQPTSLKQTGVDYTAGPTAKEAMKSAGVKQAGPGK